MVGSGSADEPLVAREAELSKVLSAHSAVATGSGRLVLLTGEPGIGKTRLATEVLARAQALGNLVLVGRCFEQYTAVPFFPFTELLDAALNVAPAELKTQSTVNWPELVYLIPDVIPASPQKLEGPEAQLRLFRATLSFLQALAAIKPLVLLLEDVHWADATSLALLLFLGRHLDAARMLILATYRDVEVGRQHPLEATVRELLRERAVEEMHLRRLSTDGTAALMRAQLGAASVSDELVKLVHGRAEGNPFFTEELLTAFVEKGALATGEGRVGLAGIDEVEVPRSIRSVIGERVGRLPRQSQELLRLASLLGHDFDLEMLLAVSGQTEADVLDGLDAALEAGIIGGLRKDREHFAFAHVLIQQTLYEELPVHRRRRMHLRVGQALEQVHVASSTHSADMARHFLLGGDAERAVRYAIAAGDQAAHRYAHPEASRQYQVALELLDDLDDPATTAEVQYKLGGELFDMARLSEALAAYEASLGSFRRLGDQLGQALAHWGIARLHEGVYEMASAEPHVDEALLLWPGERQDSELVRLLSDATRIKAFVGRITEFSELAERNLALAEQLGDAGLLALALSGMATHRGGARRASELRLYLERGIDLALQVGNWRALTLLYIQRAANRALTGDIDGSVVDRRLAIDAGDRSGQTERMIFAHQTLGVGLMWTGAWDDGRAAMRTALTLDALHEHPYSVVTNALLAWMEGRPEEAAGYFNQFATNSRQRHDTQGVVLGLAQLATLKVQLGRPAEAETPSRELLGVLRSYGGNIGFAAGHVAEVFIRLGTEDSESVLSELERMVDECGEELARPQLLRARALLNARQHRFDDALEALRASAALARSMHAVIELAQSLLALAPLARQKGDKVAAGQADAERLAIVERIGPEARAMAWARGLPHASRTQAASQGPLSPRECEVARLIAGGLSNRQIAQSLVISERTVENHVSSILARLGVDTRAQVAAWTVQHGLAAPAK